MQATRLEAVPEGVGRDAAIVRSPARIAYAVAVLEGERIERVLCRLFVTLMCGGHASEGDGDRIGQNGCPRGPSALDGVGLTRKLVHDIAKLNLVQK